MKLKTLATTAVLTLACSVTALAQDVTVTIDGSPASFPNQQPAIVDGRTLIPLRGVFDTMGYEIGWEANTKTVTLTKGTDSVSIQVGAPSFTLNGSSVALDVPAQIMNGSTMLPLRAIANATGAQVDWDSATKTASITTATTNYADLRSDLAVAQYLLDCGDIMTDYSEQISNLENYVIDKDISDYTQEQILALTNQCRAAIEAGTTTKAALNRLNTPDSCIELRDASIDFIDSTGKMFEPLIGYLEGNLSEEEAIAQFEANYAAVEESSLRMQTIVNAL